MTSIFISRNLSPESILNQLKDQFEITGHSLIRLIPRKITSLPVTDWIFFYSRHGVQFFFEQAPTIDEGTLFGAMGPKTAKTLSLYQNVHFVGNGKKEETAKAFDIVAFKGSVLFPRASKSLKSIQTLLAKNERFKIKDVIVYDNQIRSDLEIVDKDILVFTSPMNAFAYLEQTPLRKGQKIIAIGESTAMAIRKYKLQPMVAEKPSEESIYQLIRSHFTL